jgi:hypothetical protein
MMSSINKPPKSSFLNSDYNNLKRSSIAAKMNQSVVTSGSTSGVSGTGGRGSVILNLARNSISTGTKFKIKNSSFLETSKLLNKDGTVYKQINKKDKSNDKDAINFDPNYKEPRCHMTFIFDPNGRLSYWMGN